MKYLGVLLALSVCVIPEFGFAETLPQNQKSAEIKITDAADLFFSTKDNKEIVYNKDGSLFTGAVQKKDDEGRTVSYFYRNGLRNGVITSYFEDGKIEFEETYRQGKKEGEEIYFYENGNPKSKRTYKDDVLNGVEVLYYISGKPRQQNNYINGKLDGKTAYFDEEGNQTRIENYKDGLKNGVEHIIVENMLQEENNYVNGKKTGLSKKYNKEYMTDEINYLEDKKDGISRHYNKDGSVIEIPYENDVKNGVGVAYYPDKKIANKATYLNDMKNGLSEKFFPNGQRQSAETYKNDKLEGIGRYYDQNGNLLSVKYFVDGMELSVMNLAKDSEFGDISSAFKGNKLGRFYSQKNMWYPVLWFGINLENPDILRDLEKNMKMYNVSLDDTKAYARESKSKYQEYNRRLFFGLTPLGYAVNLSAPAEILQNFATPEHINEENPRGGTALQEAIRLNNLDMVKYLLLKNADVKKTAGGSVVAQAVQEKVRLAVIEELLKAGAAVETPAEDGSTPLLMAVRNNNGRLVDLLLQYQANPHILLPDGKNLLFWAVVNQADDEIIDKLLKAGVNVNQKDAAGEVILLKALAQNNSALVEKLLQSGADVNLADSSGESAATYVIENPVDESFIRQIYGKDVDVYHNVGKEKQPLWRILAAKEKWNLLREVFEKMGGVDKADANGEVPLQVLLLPENKVVPELEEILLSYVNTAWLNANPDYIWQAAEHKNFALWQKLVALKFNPQLKNNAGKTLLFEFMEKNYPPEWLEELEKLNPDLNEANTSGLTPLDFAVRNNNVGLVRNLLAHGAAAGLPAHDYLVNLTAEQAEITELLLQNGANTSVVLLDNRTLLMNAVENLNEPLVQSLLLQGIAMQTRDNDGNIAVHYLLEAVNKNETMPEDELLSRFSRILALLTQYGLDINAQNGNGETLLIRLALQKNKLYAPLSEILMQQGADISLKDQYGRSAADYAAKFGKADK